VDSLRIKNANRAMGLITMPSALLSRILLTQDPRQKQVVIVSFPRSWARAVSLDPRFRPRRN